MSGKLTPSAISFYLVMKETSANAYKVIKAKGLLGTRRLQVYEALALSDKPLTQNEVWDKIQETGVSLMLNSVTPRFAELEDLGVIKVVGERTCDVTGHKDTTYTDTGDLPDESRIKEKREVWHITVKLKDNPDDFGTRVEHSKKSANDYAKKNSDRVLEIIHFREVLKRVPTAAASNRAAGH